MKLSYEDLVRRIDVLSERNTALEASVRELESELAGRPSVVKLQARVAELEAILMAYRDSRCTPEERAVLDAITAIPDLSLGALLMPATWVTHSSTLMGALRAELARREAAK